MRHCVQHKHSISFFGKHIGSDRIYIFEDDEEHHVTNNTYEWCAEGITPQIEHLQGVNMEVIDWCGMILLMREKVLLFLMLKN